MEKDKAELAIVTGTSSITIRVRGDHEPCSACEHDVEIFSQLALKARFLIVRLKNHQALGGGKCPACGKIFCIGCATKTVYGDGMRRLHCPDCGKFLVGLRAQPQDTSQFGAFLDEPPEFAGHGEPAMAPEDQPKDVNEQE